MATPQKVVAYEPTRSRTGSWLARWTVDGVSTSRSRQTKVQAERVRRAILDAADRGERFDPVTREPESWSRGESVLAFALDWFPSAWPAWRPKTRIVNLDGTIAAVLALTDAPVSSAHSALLRPWLHEALAPAGAPAALPSDVRRAVDWLHAHSLPLSSVNAGHVRAAYTSFTRNLDGSEAMVNTFTKRRSGVTRLLGAAAEQNLIPANPASGIRLARRKKTKTAVMVSEIPTVLEAQALIATVGLRSSASRRLVAFLATSLYAGLRPGEVSALRPADLDLPDMGWGLARVMKSRVTVARRYTDDGSTVSEGDTKTGVDRVVPLHPNLVGLIRLHLELWPPAAGGCVFTNRAGGAPHDNIHRVLEAARDSLGWTGTHRLAGFHNYSLRHCCASVLLEAGMAPANVAERMGHSIDELTRTYWHVMNMDNERLNAQIESAF